MSIPPTRMRVEEADGSPTGQPSTLKFAGCTVSYSGATATVTPAGGSGDFVGPASALDGSIVLFDGTTGKLGKDAAVVLSAFAKTILDDANAAAVRTTIGAGTISGSLGSTDNVALRSDGTGGVTAQGGGVGYTDNGATLINGGTGIRIFFVQIGGGSADTPVIDVVTSNDTNRFFVFGFDPNAYGRAAAAEFRISNAGVFGLSSSGSPTGSSDCGISRGGVADIAFGNGSAANASATLQFGGGRCRGLTSSTGAASTTEYPTSGDWGLHKNTTTGVTSVVRNDGGAIKSVPLA